MRTTLAFALVATAAFAAGESDSDDAAAAEQEMVLDPSTGEMAKAPQYGGVITYSEHLGCFPKRYSVFLLVRLILARSRS